MENQEQEKALSEMQPGILTHGVQQIQSLVRNITLKVKEYTGRLEEPEMEKILFQEFQSFKKTHPPLMEDFSPEDGLERIKKSSGEEKKHLLLLYKAKWSIQRKAWAKCQVLMEKHIEHHHDVPRIKVAYWVEEFGRLYGFTDEQKKKAYHILDRYYEQRKIAQETRKQYPEDTELIKVLTGEKVKKGEPIEITVGPMSIDIKTEEPTFSKMYGKNNNEIGTPLGFASFAYLNEETVKYTVENNDLRMQMLTGDFFGTRTKAHEHQHHKNALYQEVFVHNKGQREIQGHWEKYKGERNQEKKLALLESYFNGQLEYALEHAKDEIIAFTKTSGLLEFTVAFKGLFFSKDELQKLSGLPYEYLTHLADKNPGEEVLLQQSMQNIVMTQYETVLTKGYYSFLKLVIKGIYTPTEAVALLADKAIKDWPKTVDRLLAKK